MKPAARFEGVIHDRVECPDVGGMFAVTVIGADAGSPGTVSLDARGRCIDMGLRLTRAQALRLGELLIQAADDGVGGAVRS